MSKGIGIAVLGLGLLGLGWWAHGHHGPRIQDHVRQLAEAAEKQLADFDYDL